MPGTEPGEGDDMEELNRNLIRRALLRWRADCERLLDPSCTGIALFTAGHPPGSEFYRDEIARVDQQIESLGE